MNCPRCEVILVPTHSTGNRFQCPRCAGVASNSSDVRLMLSYAKRSELIAAGAYDHAGLKCPFCAGQMNGVEMEHQLGVMEVDVCRPCEAVWTDAGEITKLSKAVVVPTGTDPTVPLDERQVQAEMELLMTGRNYRRDNSARNGRIAGNITEALIDLFLWR